MIQTFHIHIPVPQDVAVQPLCAKMTGLITDLMVRHPALRGGAAEASEGVLRLQLKCQGTDRWKTSRAARTIATMLLRRAALPVAEAKVVLVETPPGARSLTLEQGRPPTPPAPRKRGRKATR